MAARNRDRRLAVTARSWGDIGQACSFCNGREVSPCALGCQERGTEIWCKLGRLSVSKSSLELEEDVDRVIRGTTMRKVNRASWREEITKCQAY